MAILKNVFILFLILSSLSFAQVFIDGCTNISESGNYVLSANLMGSNVSNSCILINSSNVYFNCRLTPMMRFNITGNESGVDTYGIHIQRPDLVPNLNNITIANCGDGSYLSGISNYTYGIYAPNASFNVYDSTFTNNSYGIYNYLKAANSANYSGNTFINNTAVGFIFESLGLNISSNHFNLNNRSIEMTASGYINVTDNVFGNDSEYGVVSFSSDHLLISSNNFTNTEAGTFLSGAFLGEFLSNRFTNIPSYCLNIGSDTTLFNFSANTFSNCTTGIYYASNLTNNFTYNSISNSDAYGFYASSQGSSTEVSYFTSNNITSSLNGIFLQSLGTPFFVSDNIINLSTSSSVYLTSTSNLDFSSNTVSSNSGDGLLLHNVSSSNFSLNNISGSSGSGVFINQSTGNNFSSNRILSNNLNGIHSNLSTSNTILDNNISLNNQSGILLNRSSIDLDGGLINSNLNRGIFVVQTSNLTATDTILRNNSVYFDIDNFLGTASTINLTRIIFDTPAGALQDYMNVTLFDSVATLDQYSLNWSTVPSSLPSDTVTFEYKYLNITNSSPISLDSVSFTWDDSETPGYNESRLVLYKFNSSGWSILNNSPNTISNTLSLSSVSSFSVFAILENQSSSSGSTPSSDGGSSSPPLSSRYDFGASFTCADGLRLSLENNRGSRVDSSFVVFDSDYNEIASGSSGSSGYYYFNGVTPYCGQTLRLRARLSSGTLDRSFSVDCSSCAPRPACTLDSDCSSGYMCSSGRCVLIPRPECIVDSDCSSTSICSSSRCVAISCPSGRIVDRVCVPILDNSTIAPECTSDASCASDSYCARGPSGAYVCTSISTEGRCGEIQNHQFVSFQCGSSPSCSACPSNYTCSNHRCVGYSLNAPERGVVGSQIDVFALLGETPASGSSIRITSPDGTASTLRTDLNGRVRQLFGVPGVYRFDLIQNGTIVKSVTVTSVPRRGSPLDDLLSVASGAIVASLPWLLILLLIAFGVYYYYRRMKKN